MCFETYTIFSDSIQIHLRYAEICPQFDIIPQISPYSSCFGRNRHERPLVIYRLGDFSHYEHSHTLDIFSTETSLQVYAAKDIYPENVIHFVRQE